MGGNKGASRGDLSSLTILLVDDNAAMCKMLRAILLTLKTGPTIEAATAADALRALQEIAIDLVIIDLEMDPVDGLKLVRLIRSGEDGANRQVPIIMLTEYTDLHLVEQARDAGIDEFIAKPVSSEALYDRIIEISDHLRPFVISRAYTGPDRRRGAARPHAGRERRSQTGGVVAREK